MTQKITKFFAPAMKKEVESESTETEIRKQIQNCSVVVKDIKEEIQNGRYAGLEIVSSITEVQQKLSPKKPSSSDITCTICNRIFKQKAGLKKHLEMRHPGGITKFECDLCGKVLSIKETMRQHMSVHLPVIECHICHAMLKQRYMDGHLQNVHAKEKKFKCKICPKTFKSTQHLSHHRKVHDKKFECETCGRKFAYPHHLNKHKRYIHESPGSFACKECGKKFNRKGDLKSHQRVHDRFRSKKFKCQKCSYSTDEKRSYEYHLKSHQREEEKFAAMKNPIKCEKCRKFCRNKDFLKMHMKVVHPLEQFQCDICGNYTKTMNHLKRHINLHLTKNNIHKHVTK